MGNRKSLRTAVVGWLTLGIVVGLTQAALAPAAQAVGTSHITGTVTNSQGAPLANVAVYAYTFSGQWQAVAFASTDASGNYDVANLDAGTYRLKIFTGQSSSYVPEYWDNAATITAATDIVVGQGATVSGKNVQLADAGHITGTVTGTGGAALASAVVYPMYYDATNGVWRQVNDVVDFTDASGQYDLGELAAGTYRLQFFHDDYVIEYWDDVATVAAATDIVVTGGSTVTGKNAQLTFGSRITGRVTGPDGNALAGASVYAYAPNAAGTGWEVVQGIPYTATNSQGDYVMRRLRAGTYRVVIQGSGNYVSEWWDNAASVSAATDIVVGTNTTTTGINAQLAYSPVQNFSRPTVTGNAIVGETLTASSGTWYPSSGVSFAYQWLANGTIIDGATATTYSPALADLGKTITVRVTGSATGWAPTAATSTPTAAVSQYSVTNTAVPTITGDAYVGDTLTASTGTWSPSTDLAYAYQWYAGNTPIDGATSVTYTPTLSDVGSTIKVRVTASRTNYASGVATSTPTASVGQHAVTNTVVPTVTGDAFVGDALTASTGTWSPSTDLAYAYQWYAGNTPIDGATSVTYTPTLSDVGSTIKVRVTASRTNYTSGVATSPPTTSIGQHAVTNTAVPTVTGDPIVGETLTASTGTWTPEADLTYAYQWFAGSTPIDGATSSTYTPVRADLGQTITVEVTAARTNYTSATASSTPTATVYEVINNTEVPVISGVAQVGAELSASTGSWTPDGLTYAYQWQVDGEDSPGATASTFVVPASALGLTITVTVTASKTDAVTATAESAATDPVIEGDFNVTTPPKVKGIAKVGKTLKALPGVTTPVATTVTYKWLRNGKVIKKATKATYRLTKADKGAAISFIATYKADGYNDLKQTSTATKPVT